MITIPKSFSIFYAIYILDKEWKFSFARLYSQVSYSGTITVLYLDIFLSANHIELFIDKFCLSLILLDGSSFKRVEQTNFGSYCKDFARCLSLERKLSSIGWIKVSLICHISLKFISIFFMLLFFTVIFFSTTFLNDKIGNVWSIFRIKFAS